MNENIQNQINAQNEEAHAPENVIASVADLPMLTSLSPEIHGGRIAWKSTF